MGLRWVLILFRSPFLNVTHILTTCISRMQLKIHRTCIIALPKFFQAYYFLRDKTFDTNVSHDARQANVPCPSKSVVNLICSLILRLLSFTPQATFNRRMSSCRLKRKANVVPANVGTCSISSTYSRPRLYD